MPKHEPNHWIFSNKPADTYGGNIWDHGTTLKTKRFYFNERERNRERVRPGDVGILRIFSAAYEGRFEVGEWHAAGDWTETNGRKLKIGYFEMKRLVRWKRPVPQQLIIRDLSNGDVRSRLVRITAEDVLKIEIAQRVYQRLGYGSADGQVILLEKSLAEAIKPNLAQLGEIHENVMRVHRFTHEKYLACPD